jgi:hypothetical protein
LQYNIRQEEKRKTATSMEELDEKQKHGKSFGRCDVWKSIVSS